MAALIKQGKFIDEAGQEQDVVFIGAEKAIFDDDGNRLDQKLLSMKKASGIDATDTYGLVVSALGETTAQALIDAIANKVMNQLIEKSQIVNNLLATIPGNVLDATQGKALGDQLNSYVKGAYFTTLSSPSQLTSNGYYHFPEMSSAVNDNAGSNPMNDYSVGDFTGLLLASSDHISSSGCMYGCFLVSTPRMDGIVYIGTIWEYKFSRWKKIT